MALALPVFPSVICALAGASRKALDRRLDVALGLLGEHPGLDRSPAVRIYLCHLEDLRGRGPFAPIFHVVGGGGGAVDWLGEAEGGPAQEQ